MENLKNKEQFLHSLKQLELELEGLRQKIVLTEKGIKKEYH